MNKAKKKMEPKPILTINIFDDRKTTYISGDLDTVALMNIIVNLIPMEMRKMIEVAAENNDIIERILIRATNKTLRTWRPF